MKIKIFDDYLYINIHYKTANMFMQESERDILKDIDRKIVLTFFKEGKTSRTYVSGLIDFLTENEIEKFTKSLKTKLGAGLLKRKLNDKDKYDSYGYNGDHKEKIRDLLLENFPDKVKEDDVHL